MEEAEGGEVRQSEEEEEEGSREGKRMRIQEVELAAKALGNIEEWINEVRAEWEGEERDAEEQMQEAVDHVRGGTLKGQRRSCREEGRSGVHEAKTNMGG